jgi:hypothetical protein
MANPPGAIGRMRRHPAVTRQGAVREHTDDVVDVLGRPGGRTTCGRPYCPRPGEWKVS